LEPFDPVLIAVICTGACTGVILPDLQMKKPQGFQVRSVAWLISRFSTVVFIPLICRLYHTLWGHIIHGGDKRLTHSFPGIVCHWVIFAVFLPVPAFILMGSTSPSLPAAFLCGVMLGLVLHLIEDLCTRKGITPFFPFSTMTVSGSIRPCDTTDRRIAQFHYYSCSVAGIILGFQYLGNGRGIESLPLCLFGMGSCLGMMIWSSDVSISRESPGDPVNEIRSPVLLDPFIVQWKASHSPSGLMMGVYYF